MDIWKHFQTITHHKLMVMKGCFAVGLYWQGLTHDLSKYMPSEFFVGARYYQGTQSPNNAERMDRTHLSSPPAVRLPALRVAKTPRKYLTDVKKKYVKTRSVSKYYN